MSSRRKSSIPCMVRVGRKNNDDLQELTDVLAEPDDRELSESAKKHDANTSAQENQNSEPLELEEEARPHEAPPPVQVLDAVKEKNKNQADSASSSEKDGFRGYECKYCPMVAQNLNDFKDHVDSQHPKVILNPLYHCAVCDFNTNKFDFLTEHNESRHPGETNFNFKKIKKNNQTTLEQTIEDKTSNKNYSGVCKQGESNGSNPLFVSTAMKTAASLQLLFGGTDLKSQLDGLVQKDQITAVTINGTVIIPEPAVIQGLCHVSPSLQRPPNFSSIPKVAVPLHTNKYNPSLDDNLTLISSFNKFPYPTYAELSWLTAASKHPEEQIRVWFTTQRLKQGITWSPEEVEEARKKMFNGSIPPVHHTFTPLTSPCQEPLVHTTIEHSSQAWTTLGNGNPLTGSSFSLKRPLQTYLAAAFGPEAKRPIMAVAPHSGDPKDKLLMAPPPPPPPQKDRVPMAPPHTPSDLKRPLTLPLLTSEMKRPPATVPLMPPPLSPPSSKGKILSMLGSPKTRPVVSLPSFVFPESLTRRTIVPPPFFAPPFKNPILFPHLTPKEKPPNSYSAPNTDLSLPTSPSLMNSQKRRPTIIQAIPTPALAPSLVLGFPRDSKKLKEQQDLALNASYPPRDSALSPGSETRGVSHREEKPSPDSSSPTLNNAEEGEASVLTQFPLLERMKGKTANQLKVLEENFLRNSFPTFADLDSLSGSTRLSQQEVESWFVERRALRDNLEQALINSMGTKKMGDKQRPTLPPNGLLKATPGTARLHSLPSPLAVLAPIQNSVPADSRALALLQDNSAPPPWPCPEELHHTGLLSRWFNNNRFQSSRSDLMELLGVNGGQTSTENHGSGNVPRWQEGALSHGRKLLELELLMEHRTNIVNNHQRQELQERFVGRLRPELKNTDAFWLEDGTPRKGRDLLERERKMMEESSGRLTG